MEKACRKPKPFFNYPFVQYWTTSLMGRRPHSMLIIALYLVRQEGLGEICN